MPWEAEQDLRTWVCRVNSADDCTVSELNEICSYHGLNPAGTPKERLTTIRRYAASAAYQERAKATIDTFHRHYLTTQAVTTGVDMAGSRAISIVQQFRDAIGASFTEARASSQLRSLVYAYLNASERARILQRHHITPQVRLRVFETLARWEEEDAEQALALFNTCTGVEGLPSCDQALPLNDLVVVKPPWASESVRSQTVTFYWRAWSRLAGEVIFAGYESDGQTIKWSAVRELCMEPSNVIQNARASTNFFESEKSAATVKTCHRCGKPGHFERNCPQKGPKDGQRAGKKGRK